MRLPDGNLDGLGFSSNNYLSLGKLKSREIYSISALDHSTLYHDWEDFYFTLNKIIVYENEKISNTWINYLNPGLDHDHPDHRITGNAVQAMSILLHVKQGIFSGYECGSSELISSIDLFWKAGMLAAYEKAVFDNNKYSTLKENVSQYLDWCFRKAHFIKIT